jgi:hypothetical protein
MLQSHYTLEHTVNLTKVMPRDSDEVTCTHCHLRVSRHTERRHLRLASAPVPTPVPTHVPISASTPAPVTSGPPPMHARGTQSYLSQQGGCPQGGLAHSGISRQTALGKQLQSNIPK